VTALPQEAIAAAAEAVHRLCCEDGQREPPDSHDTSMAKTILEAAAPYMAALPRCPTPCDADCEQACHEVHDVPSHREHNPESCVATVIAAAATAERERIRQGAERAAEDALAGERVAPGFEPLTRYTWAKALTWFAMELSEGNPATRAAEIAQRAEEIHAEHHAGYIVPSLDSCDEHTRAEYEALVRDLLTGSERTP
jgi:hypothetical protein